MFAEQLPDYIAFEDTALLAHRPEQAATPKVVPERIPHFEHLLRIY